MKRFLFLSLCLALSGCHRSLPPETLSALAGNAPIFPNYSACDIVLPYNIAPLHFCVLNPQAKTVVLYPKPKTKALNDAFSTKVCWGQVHFSLTDWQKCLQLAKGGDVLIQIKDKNQKVLWQNTWHIANEAIDPYLLYRLSAYDQNPCQNLEVEQRNLENFDVKVLMNNRQINNNCMNCHTSGAHNPNYLMVHLRGDVNGTLIYLNGKFVKIKLPNGYPNLRLTYPAWHPSHSLIAFSTTRIEVHSFSNLHKTQDLIIDTLGRIVVYDIKNNKLWPTPSNTGSAPYGYEASFPVWSANGKQLFFCRVENISPLERSTASQLKKFKYHIAVMDFDSLSNSFSSPRALCIDTAWSLSLPTISPDGRYLVVTQLPLGSFPSQNSGDLALIDLQKMDSVSGLCPLQSLDVLNSKDGEKSHQFSSNGRWMVFGSKRLNGSNAQLYIAYFDRKGCFHSPFILPQKQGDFYASSIRSFLFPVLNKGAAHFTAQAWAKAAKGEALSIDMDLFQNEYQAGKTAPSAGGH